MAVGLARHGVRVAMIDRVDPVTALDRGFDGRAFAIALSSQRLLAALGIWPRLTVTSRSARSAFRTEIHSFPALRPRRLGNEPLAIWWRIGCCAPPLATAITEEAARIIRLTPATVTGLAQGPDRATLTLADGRTVDAGVVVAADGRTSLLRELAGIPLVGWTYDQMGIVATIGHARPHDGIAHEHFPAGGPLRHSAPGRRTSQRQRVQHRSSLVWTERADATRIISPCRRKRSWRRSTGGWAGSGRAVAHRPALFASPRAAVRARYVDKRLCWRATPPTHSSHRRQGVNLGYRDVAALVEIIVDAKRLGLDLAHPSGLARYERWRRADICSWRPPAISSTGCSPTT